MGINKKKLILNVVAISVLSSLATGINCYATADELQSVNNITETETTIIKKLDHEYELQNVVDTYNTIKSNELVQAKKDTFEYIENTTTSNEYSANEKKTLCLSAIKYAVDEEVLSQEESDNLTIQVTEELEKQTTAENLNQTINNILNSPISVEAKRNFCDSALTLAKANGTITENDYNSKLKNINATLKEQKDLENQQQAKELADKQALETSFKETQMTTTTVTTPQDTQQQTTDTITTTVETSISVTQAQVETTTQTTTETEIVQTADEASPEYYSGFNGTLYYNDLDFLALCNAVQHEVGNCSAQSKRMVASVIVNRALSGIFPSSMYDVITQKNQFTNIEPYVNRTDYATQDTIYWCQYVLDTGVDYSNGALFYYAPQWCGYMAYFENMNLVGECDGQRYFN